MYMRAREITYMYMVVVHEFIVNKWTTGSQVLHITIIKNGYYSIGWKFLKRKFWQIKLFLSKLQLFNIRITSYSAYCQLKEKQKLKCVSEATVYSIGNHNSTVDKFMSWSFVYIIP